MSYGSLILEFLLKVSDVIYDCLENCIDTMTFAVGKNLNRVLYVTIYFFVLSLVLKIFHLPEFISWLESLTAVLIMSALCAINYVSRSDVVKLLDKLKGEGVKRNGK